MIKVVEITFTCMPQFDAEREVRAAIQDHFLQIAKKAAFVETYEVVEIPCHTIEKVARDRLAASMDRLNVALDKLREEGGLT